MCLACGDWAKVASIEASNLRQVNTADRFNPRPWPNWNAVFGGKTLQHLALGLHPVSTVSMTMKINRQSPSPSHQRSFTMSPRLPRTQRHVRRRAVHEGRSEPARSAHRNRDADPSFRLQSRPWSRPEAGSLAKGLQNRTQQNRISSAFHPDHCSAR